MTRRIRSLSLFSVVPLLAACGGAAGSGRVSSATAAHHVTIQAGDNFRFEPAEIRAHVGTFRITLTDSGSYPHNISFPALHTTSSTVSANPGQHETSITVTFPRPGTYEFVCTFHSSAGMKGHVTVS